MTTRKSPSDESLSALAHALGMDAAQVVKTLVEPQSFARAWQRAQKLFTVEEWKAIASHDAAKPVRTRIKRALDAAAFVARKSHYEPKVRKKTRKRGPNHSELNLWLRDVVSDVVDSGVLESVLYGSEYAEQLAIVLHSKHLSSLAIAPPGSAIPPSFEKDVAAIAKVELTTVLDAEKHGHAPHPPGRPSIRLVRAMRDLSNPATFAPSLVTLEDGRTRPISPQHPMAKIHDDARHVAFTTIASFAASLVCNLPHKKIAKLVRSRAAATRAQERSNLLARIHADPVARKALAGMMKELRARAARDKKKQRKTR